VLPAYFFQRKTRRTFILKKLLLGSLPGVLIGSVLSAVYAVWICIYRGLMDAGTILDYDFTIRMSYLGKKDWYIMAGLAIGVFLFILLSNLVKYLKGEREFNPFRSRSVTDISADKRKAQYLPVSKEYLSKDPVGLTIGAYRNRYVRLPFLDSPEHQLILGSPGSGKSTTLLNALIWNYNFEKDKKLGAVLAIDVKPELQKKSVAADSRNIRIINPSAISDRNYGFDVWYGLSQKSSDDQLKERMELIARAIIPDLSGDNIHFSANAQKILSGFLMYGFRKGLSFSDAIMKIIHISVEDLITEIIMDPKMKNHPKITGKVRSFDGNKSNEMASIKDTLEKDLDIFDTESVKYCFSGNLNKTTPRELLNGISLFLEIPDNLIEMYKTVFGMIMEICMKYLTSIPEEKLEDKRPIWCLIDEGGTIYIPSLLDVASRGRSKKIQLSIIAQSYSQLEDLYGERQARSILDCCKTTVVFSCNDTKTAENLSKRTGYYRETKMSYSSKGIVSEYSSSSSEEYRPVMDISDIGRLEKNNEVLVFTKGERFLVRKAPYYTIPLLLRKSNEIVAHNRKLKEDK